MPSQHAANSASIGGRAGCDRVRPATTCERACALRSRPRAAVSSRHGAGELGKIGLGAGAELRSRARRSGTSTCGATSHGPPWPRGRGPAGGPRQKASSASTSRKIGAHLGRRRHGRGAAGCERSASWAAPKSPRAAAEDARDVGARRRRRSRSPRSARMSPTRDRRRPSARARTRPRRALSAREGALRARSGRRGRPPRRPRARPPWPPRSGRRGAARPRARSPSAPSRSGSPTSCAERTGLAQQRDPGRDDRRGRPRRSRAWPARRTSAGRAPTARATASACSQSSCERALLPMSMSDEAEAREHEGAVGRRRLGGASAATARLVVEQPVGPTPAPPQIEAAALVQERGAHRARAARRRARAPRRRARSPARTIRSRPPPPPRGRGSRRARGRRARARRGRHPRARARAVRWSAASARA